MIELFANSGDPDQTPHSAASDLGLHCLPVTRLGVSSFLQLDAWVDFERAWEDLHPVYQNQNQTILLVGSGQLNKVNKVYYIAVLTQYKKCSIS